MNISRPLVELECVLCETRATSFIWSLLCRQVLKLDLKEIREQQDLLFRFMSFLKEEGAVHVLQFCLNVEEFNDRILCPDLSDEEMMRLHEEVKKIYETYCLEESIDKISFDPFIVEEIHSIAQGPFRDVVKLQTMRCLFEAYEHVLCLLEKVFTPMFCHSDEYFRHLLCGAESPARNSKLNRILSMDDLRFPLDPIYHQIQSQSLMFELQTDSGNLGGEVSIAQSQSHTHILLNSPSYRIASIPEELSGGTLKGRVLMSVLVHVNRNTSKRGETFGISRIGSKIKGVFKSSTMEGAMLPQYAMIDGEDDMVGKPRCKGCIR
ncbi:hypothetical protein DNTS_032412 [Danionella cerebrum]|uniref:RGS domain-containing protein n=1 Tax=Danionella cerebrum TaxID=2873325 RepID=A0A553N152_9TELE|nr:hypothetical protein DNTS_032412 [Danionella translucida]